MQLRMASVYNHIQKMFIANSSHETTGTNLIYLAYKSTLLLEHET
jgi:hypothetical protein